MSQTGCTLVAYHDCLQYTFLPALINLMAIIYKASPVCCRLNLWTTTWLQVLQCNLEFFQLRKLACYFYSSKIESLGNWLI